MTATDYKDAPNCYQTASCSFSICSKINAKCHRCCNNCNHVAFSWRAILFKTCMLYPCMQCLHNQQIILKTRFVQL